MCGKKLEEESVWSLTTMLVILLDSNNECDLALVFFIESIYALCYKIKEEKKGNFGDK